MIESALEYAKDGWHVFPIRPNDKRPLLGGNGFLDATTNEEQIREWWGQNPKANIGISLDPSGLCVIDIDTHGNVNGYESLPLLGDLPETLSALTAGGGGHLIFSNGGNPPPRKTNLLKDKGGKGIDLLSKGYIVAAPSVVNGKAYTWDKIRSPALLPDHVREIAEPKAEAPAPWQAPRAIKKDNLLPGDDYNYRGDVEGLLIGHGWRPCGVGKWTRPGKESGVSATFGRVGEGVHAERKFYCFTPNAGLEPGTSYDPIGLYAALECGGDITQASRELADLGYGSQDRSTEILSSLSGFFDNLNKRFPSEPEKKASTPKPDLTNLPDKPDLCDRGLMKSLYEWIESCSFVSRPMVSESAALMAMSMIVGRDFRVDTLRSFGNLYISIVVPSGGGKDNSLRRMRDVADAINRRNSLLTDFNTVTSVEEILDSSGECFMVVDEEGDMLAANKAGAKTNKTLAAINGAKKSLWSSAGSTYVGGTRRVDNKNVCFVIDNPYVCSFGASTPRQFFSAMTGADVEGGQLARSLIIFDDEYKASIRPQIGVTNVDTEMPDSIRDCIKSIRWPDKAVNVGQDDAEASPIITEANRANGVHPVRDIRITQEASDWLHDRGENLKRDGKTEAECAFYARYMELSLRIGLLLAISDAVGEGKLVDQACISLDVAQRAGAWVYHNTVQKVTLVSDRVEVSEAEQLGEKLVKACEKTDALTRKQVQGVFYRSSFSSARKWQSIVTALINSGQLIEEIQGDAKRFAADGWRVRAA
jgi:hypothetical protein